MGGRSISTRDPVGSGTSTTDVSARAEQPVGRSRRWDADRVLFTCALAVALLPFVVSGVALTIGGRGYRSFFDRALLEVTVREVGRHAVNVGAYSLGKWHHPGPALFYALAIPYRLLGGRPWSLLVGALVVNAAAVVGVGIVARRRAGTGFALAALAGTSIVTHALGPSFVRDPWNPFVLAMPMALLVFLTWSITEGDTSALPWVGGVASFVVQAHVGTLVPVMSIVGAGGIMLALRRRSERREGTAAGSRRPMLTGGMVLVVLWLPPLVDAATHSGGNLRTLFDYFRDARSRQTLGAGAKTVAAQLTVPPPWLTGDPLRHAQILDVRLTLPHAPIPWIGLCSVIALALAWRRGARTTVRLGLIVVVALVAAAVAISRVSEDLTYWFAAYVPVLGMLAALATGYALWETAFARRRVPRALRRGVAALLGVAIGLPAITLAVSSADARRVPQREESQAIEAVSSGTLRALRRIREPVLVRAAGGSWPALPALVALLEGHGIRTLVQSRDPFAIYLPASVQRGGQTVGAVVTITAATRAASYPRAPRERLVAGHALTLPDLPPELNGKTGEGSHLSSAQRDHLVASLQARSRAAQQFVVFLSPARP